jgi:hypothetical protein
MDEKFKRLIKDKKNLGETIKYLRSLNDNDNDDTIKETIEKLVSKLGEIELHFIYNRIGYYSDTIKPTVLPKLVGKQEQSLILANKSLPPIKTIKNTLDKDYWKDDYIRLESNTSKENTYQNSNSSKRKYVDNMNYNDRSIYYFNFDKIDNGCWYHMYQIEDFSNISNYHETIKRRIKFYCYIHKVTGKVCVYRLDRTDAKSGIKMEYYLSDDDYKLYVINDNNLIHGYYKNIPQYWRVQEPEFAQKKQRYYS